MTCCIWHVWCTAWTEHAHFDFVALLRELPCSTSSGVVCWSPVVSAALLWCSQLDYSAFSHITIPEIIKNKIYLLGKMLKFVFIFRTEGQQFKLMKVWSHKKCFQVVLSQTMLSWPVFGLIKTTLTAKIDFFWPVFMVFMVFTFWDELITEEENGWTSYMELFPWPVSNFLD